MLVIYPHDDTKSCVTKNERQVKLLEAPAVSTQEKLKRKKRLTDESKAYLNSLIKKWLRGNFSNSDTFWRIS